VKTCVLDASALMAFFENRAGADQVEDLLAKAADRKKPLLMSVVNWGEVYYSIWRARGERAAHLKLREIAQLPIEVVDADMELTQAAARLKAAHNLPYADCFAAALARSRKANLVTSDKDFARAYAPLLRQFGSDSRRPR
jgi:ribonuclease VapC